MVANKIKVNRRRGDERMKTLHKLMLRGTPHDEVLRSDISKETITIEEAISYCDSVDAVVKMWHDSILDHGISDPDHIVGEVYGSLIVCRMLFEDLKVLRANSKAECVALLDATQVISGLKQAMIPMSKSYAKTPTLCQWYMTLGNEIDMCYRAIRRRLKNGGK
jgi:hypothetical protein